LASVALVATSSAAGAAVFSGPVQVVTSTDYLYAVACPPSSGNCMAVGAGGSVLPVTNGIAGTGMFISANLDLSGVACPAAGTCVAVGVDDGLSPSEGVVVPITNGVPGTPNLVPAADSLGGVACVSATLCYGVGDTTGGPDGDGLAVVVTLTNGTPSSVQTAAPVGGTTGAFSGSLRGIECQVSGSCLAVGTGNTVSDNSEYGAVVPVVSGTPGSAEVVPTTEGGFLTGIACETASICAAVGAREVGDGLGYMVPVSNGELGTLSDLSSGGDGALQFAVTCQDANDCLAAGFVQGASVDTEQGTVLPITGTAAATLQDIAGAVNLDGIACWDTTQCIAVGGPYDGGGQVVDIATGPPSITTTSLPTATVKSAYSATLSATGGIPPYTWSASAGVLPPGLSLNASSGTISGTPTTAETSTVTFTVTDASSPAQTATATIAIEVNPVLSVASTSLPAGTVGVSYAASLSASWGTAPYSWSTKNKLPAGLTLNASNGAITGTPTKAGTTSLTFEATDSSTPAQKASSKALKLVIGKGSQTISFTSTPGSTTEGSTYTVTASATSGLTVRFSLDRDSTRGACRISSDKVTYTGAGNCIIDANQAGNVDYLKAPEVQQVIDAGG
jgi:hypothetical protein